MPHIAPPPTPLRTSPSSLSDHQASRPVLRRRVPLFIIPAAYLLLAGCSPDPEGRVPVSGTVTFAGAPLASGTIEFHPLDDGSPTGGMIREGRFEIPALQGPLAGDHKVKIYATDPSGGPSVDPNAAPGDSSMPLPPELIPERYNAQTELMASLGARGDKALSFDLEP